MSKRSASSLECSTEDSTATEYRKKFLEKTGKKSVEAVLDDYRKAHEYEITLKVKVSEH